MPRCFLFTAALLATGVLPGAEVEFAGVLKYSDYVHAESADIPLAAYQDLDAVFEVWFVDQGGCEGQAEAAIDLAARASREFGLRYGFDHIEVFCQAIAEDRVAMAVSFAGASTGADQGVSARCYSLRAGSPPEQADYLGRAGWTGLVTRYSFAFTATSGTPRHGVTFFESPKGREMASLDVLDGRGPTPWSEMRSLGGDTVRGFVGRPGEDVCLYALTERPGAPGSAQLRLARICDTAEYLPLATEEGRPVSEEYVPTTGPGSSKAQLEGSKAFALYQRLLEETGGRELQLDLPQAIKDARRALEQQEGEQTAESLSDEHGQRQ